MKKNSYELLILFVVCIGLLFAPADGYSDTITISADEISDTYLIDSSCVYVYDTNIYQIQVNEFETLEKFIQKLSDGKWDIANNQAGLNFSVNDTLTSDSININLIRKREYYYEKPKRKLNVTQYIEVK